MLEGRVAVHTEFYDPVTLSAGESVYIDSRMGHAYLADGDCEHALVVCVCSTTQEELLDNAASQSEPDPVAVVRTSPGSPGPARTDLRRTAPVAAQRGARTRARAD